MCGRLDEDGADLLLKCKEVKGAWRELNLEQVRCNLAAAETAREMMEKVLKLKPDVQRVVVLKRCVATSGRGREINGVKKGGNDRQWKWRT